MYILSSLKTYDDKIGELDKLLKQSKKIDSVNKNGDAKSFKCKDCGETFEKKVNLKEHIQKIHPKVYKCNECNKTFSDSWRMEEHMKTHESVKSFKCNVCDKEFYVRWRLEKHIAGHNEMGKFCHYFNNEKFCPYDKIGCKFKHEDAGKCDYDINCKFKLCQFKHSPKAEYFEETGNQLEQN